MIRKVDVGSVFGTAQRTNYEYMKLLNKKTNGNFKTLVVDDKDGLHLLPFANHGSKVVIYEPNEIYINGGIIENITITPITNRKYFKENESKIEDKYDFVYCYRSLHENHNKKIPMKRKIRKLLSSVKDNGYIYIFYHMAKNEKDIKEKYTNIYDLGKQYIDNIEKYKFSTWYDWIIENWGTKWNVDDEVSVIDTGNNEYEILFDTAWDLPNKIMLKFSNFVKMVNFIRNIKTRVKMNTIL